MKGEPTQAPGDQPGTQTAVDVVKAAMIAYERGDLTAMAAFVHPDADIKLLGLGGVETHGADGLHEALSTVGKRLHRPRMTAVEPVGDDAAVMIGRIQYGDPASGQWDSPAVWLSIVRDGKIWRSRAFGSVDEARAAYPALSQLA
jgi:ketosteroid isomerase-like protein